MTRKQDTQKRVRELKRRIDSARDRIRQIQSECVHPSETLVKTHHSDTGNYDPSHDCYWTTFHCQICDKSWHEDGSK
jgi:hypothetical protein